MKELLISWCKAFIYNAWVIFIIAVLSLLFSCKTIKTEPITTPINYDKQLKELSDRKEWLIYDVRVENCFQGLDICRLQKKDEKACWSKHEACVINAYREFKYWTK